MTYHLVITTLVVLDSTTRDSVVSPFSRYLHQLRMQYGIRQSELAELIGYEQSYISALEVGSKGPPTEEFVERLIQSIELNPTEQDELRKAAAASHRKLVIPADVPEETYWLLQDFRAHLAELRPVQIRLIREILGIQSELGRNVSEPVRRLRRRQNKEDIEM
nr:helix-turn-helix transcriptional regulator [Chromobacterium piscinae]